MARDCRDYSPGSTNMIKRTVLSLLALTLLCCFVGCDSDASQQETSEPTWAVTDEPDSSVIEQNDSAYMVHTEWMTLCFSKKDYDEAEVGAISEEATRVMADIRGYLGVSYTLDDAEGAVCYFDCDYRYNEEENRSWCFWNERKMYCVTLDDFVHEYTHMVSNGNQDLVYYPGKLFSEGLAQYVSYRFYDEIASEAYAYFKGESDLESSNPFVHQTVCELLSRGGLPHNASNYMKAFVAVEGKMNDISKVDPDSDFYNYQIGFVFVDYYVEQFGGIKGFMALYCDSITMSDLYGRTIDELVTIAYHHNMNSFFKNKRAGAD